MKTLNWSFAQDSWPSSGSGSLFSPLPRSTRHIRPPHRKLRIARQSLQTEHNVYPSVESGQHRSSERAISRPRELKTMTKAADNATASKHWQASAGGAVRRQLNGQETQRVEVEELLEDVGTIVTDYDAWLLLDWNRGTN
mmetsp:Transcript_147245/g.256979  ORF Transcript_147245/g.256979 Transcript_147245/m.256979 type:complete len:140 (+) Transcript_147245:136-555(+)